MAVQAYTVYWQSTHLLLLPAGSLLHLSLTKMLSSFYLVMKLSVHLVIFLVIIAYFIPFSFSSRQVVDKKGLSTTSLPPTSRGVNQGFPNFSGCDPQNNHI